LNSAKYIATHTSLSNKSIVNTLTLLTEGATIPFIARYRKETTGNLSEIDIQKISDLQKEYNDLEKRRQPALKTLEEQGA